MYQQQVGTLQRKDWESCEGSYPGNGGGIFIKLNHQSAWNQDLSDWPTNSPPLWTYLDANEIPTQSKEGFGMLFKGLQCSGNDISISLLFIKHNRGCGQFRKIISIFGNRLRSVSAIITHRFSPVMYYFSFIQISYHHHSDLCLASPRPLRMDWLCPPLTYISWGTYLQLVSSVRMETSQSLGWTRIHIQPSSLLLYVSVINRERS